MDRPPVLKRESKKTRILNGAIATETIAIFLISSFEIPLTAR